MGASTFIVGFQAGFKQGQEKGRDPPEEVIGGGDLGVRLAGDAARQGLGEGSFR